MNEGHALLADARKVPVPRTAIAAALPTVLARRDLARPDFTRWTSPPGSVVMQRGLGDKLAVIRAAVSGGLWRRARRTPGW
ncbi:MAG: hypothetical protein ABSC06_31170 [Rhodopila sp.]